MSHRPNVDNIEVRSEASDDGQSTTNHAYTPMNDVRRTQSNITAYIVEIDAEIQEYNDRIAVLNQAIADLNVERGKWEAIDVQVEE